MAWRSSSAASPTPSEPFVTHELIADPAAYERLSEGRDAGDFFPAYRAPA